jgi:tRNA dimethylallyltransferase
LNRKPVIVIGGPTASGKSALALDVAGEFGGEIVNADSMQIYRDLHVLTARPGPDDVERTPHHLYGVLGTDERCSAGQWRARALGAIEDIHRRGALPVVVGGTGLYLRALMTGLHRMPSVPAAIRDELNDRLQAQGAGALHAELMVCDPETATGLNEADGQRIVRALEIFNHTGRGLKSWQSGETEAAPEDLRFLKIVMLPPRDMLYERVNSRFAGMIENGGIDEVRQLLSGAPDPDFPLLKAVGVPPIRMYLEGEIGRERLLDLGQRDTRRYAKRQMTWFRRQIIPEIAIDTQYSEINRAYIFSEISNFVLTD